MAVPVRMQPKFAVTGPPTTLFSGSFDFSFDPNWDVGPDGMLRPSARPFYRHLPSQ
jgi:hypothetical protein